ncbi:MAG: NAD(P)-dependent oxidoreductase [Acidobacteria bacterium]|nr:NAD(P)-dependent oxidoreductase [Acidobacteriota bacterium]
MKVLVTGASGLIGAHVTQALLDQGVEPVACDTAPFVPPMGADSKSVPFVQADVSDLDALSSILETHQIDRVVHSAAILARTCQENPTLAVNVNVVGSLNVLEAARRLGLARVVMASSIAVYGNATSDPIDETHPLNPTTVYGSAKVLVEACGHAYRKNHGLGFVALRYGATYGPGPEKPTSMGVATDLRSFFERAVQSGEVILSDQDDLKRPLVYVKDAARATALACCRQEPAPSSVFNVAGDRAVSLAECAEVLARLLPGLKITRPENQPAPGAVRPQSVALSIDRAKAELGYEPEYPLERGIGEYVEWLQRGVPVAASELTNGGSHD